MIGLVVGKSYKIHIPLNQHSFLLDSHTSSLALAAPGPGVPVLSFHRKGCLLTWECGSGRAWQRAWPFPGPWARRRCAVRRGLDQAGHSSRPEGPSPTICSPSRGEWPGMDLHLVTAQHLHQMPTGELRQGQTAGAISHHGREASGPAPKHTHPTPSPLHCS